MINQSDEHAMENDLTITSYIHPWLKLSINLKLTKTHRYINIYGSPTVANDATANI